VIAGPISETPLVNESAEISQRPNLAVAPAAAERLLPSEPLSLSETLRIMDVASALRREREHATRALDAEQVQEQLRQRLQATAEITGEPLSVAEIDAAIQHYYSNLHAFREPARDLRWFMAHLYIRRFWLGLATLVATTGLAAWLLFS